MIKDKKFIILSGITLICFIFSVFFFDDTSFILAGLGIIFFACTIRYYFIHTWKDTKK